MIPDDGVTSRFDCVFWNGDLNFRLEKERERLDWKIDGIESQENPNFGDLMVHDELFRVRNEGKSSGFHITLHMYTTENVVLE